MITFNLIIPEKPSYPIDSINNLVSVLFDYDCTITCYQTIIKKYKRCYVIDITNFCEKPSGFVHLFYKMIQDKKPDIKKMKRLISNTNMILMKTKGAGYIWASKLIEALNTICVPKLISKFKISDNNAEFIIANNDELRVINCVFT